LYRVNIFCKSCPKYIAPTKKSVIIYKDKGVNYLFAIIVFEPKFKEVKKMVVTKEKTATKKLLRRLLLKRLL